MNENNYKRKTGIISLFTFVSMFYILGFTLMMLFDGVEVIDCIGAIISLFTAYFSIYLKRNKERDYINIKIQIASLISFIAFMSMFLYDKIQKLIFVRTTTYRFILDLIFALGVLFLIIYAIVNFIKTRDIYKTFE